MPTVTNQPNFAAGALYLVFGAGFAGLSSDHAMGTATRMGPGYFPFFLGILLGLFGLVGMVRSCSFLRKEKIILEDWDRRSLIWMIGSVVLFAVLIQYFGLIAALVFLVMLSSAASREFTWKGSLLNTVILLSLSLAVFVYGLSLPFLLWPSPAMQ
jgi:hypothetical protein